MVFFRCRVKACQPIIGLTSTYSVNRDERPSSQFRGDVCTCTSIPNRCWLSRSELLLQLIAIQILTMLDWQRSDTLAENSSPSMIEPAPYPIV